MFNYKITPKQPFIFRDGKPFGTEDNIADTLAFPLPSTLAGAIRTAWAETNNRDYQKALKKSLIGPFLTCTDINTDKSQILFPAPADSLCLTDTETTETAKSIIYKLTPEQLKENEGTNINSDKIKPVFLQTDNKGKPSKDSPKFWYQNKMIDWLLNDTNIELQANQQGIQNLPIENRTHVSINQKTQTAKAGHIFQTAGLDFGQHRERDNNKKPEKQWGWQNEEFGLACQFSAEIPETLRTIGGESRLGYIEQQDTLIPDCPEGLSQKINADKAFRLILVTPAIFTHGYLPSWIDENTMTGKYGEMKLRLHAVSVSRWQAGTSWDMASAGSKNGRGMRSLKRLVPAGTVYWFESENNVDVNSLWLSSIAYEGEDKSKKEIERGKDGYGVTVPGVWSIPENMKKKG